MPVPRDAAGASHALVAVGPSASRAEPLLASMDSEAVTVPGAETGMACWADIDPRLGFGFEAVGSRVGVVAAPTGAVLV